MATEDINIDDNVQEEVQQEAPKETGKGRGGWRRRLLKAAAWVVATPVLLVALLVASLYLPPVQRWAVDKASEWLSEETGMEVSVGSVHLGFPLDLDMGDVLATQEGDTVLHAGSLDVSVRLLPLLKAQVEVDHVGLYDTKVNTRDLIEAALVKGHVGELSLDVHSVDLTADTMLLSHALLSDADLYVALADSVPEDTTASEPTDWIIGLGDVRVERTRLQLLLSPQADSTFVGADIGSAVLHGRLDLGRELYMLTDMSVDSTDVTYGKTPLARSSSFLKTKNAGFDAENIYIRNLSMTIPSFSYAGTGDLRMRLAHLAAEERSGLTITDAQAEVEMDTLQLRVPTLALTTTESQLRGAYRMDLNAFDLPTEDNPDVVPGSFHAVVSGVLGKGDIIPFTAEAMPEFAQAWPARPMNVSLAANGNLQHLEVTQADALMAGVFNLESSATLVDVTDAAGTMGIVANFKAKMHDPAFVKGFVPADSRNAFSLPREMGLDGSFSMASQLMKVKAALTTPKGGADVDADYALNNDSYRIDADLKGFNVNQFVALDEPLTLTAALTANGRGFDVFAPSTTLTADVSLRSARYGKYDLDNSEAEVELANGNVELMLDCDNPVLATHLVLDAKMQRKAVDAKLDIDLNHADLQAMGFSEEPFTAASHGTLALRTDLGNTYYVDANIYGLDLMIGPDEVHTDHFDLSAVTNPDTTVATLRTGDLSFDFTSPDNLFTVIAKTTDMMGMATEHARKHNLNIYYLRRHMPTVTLHADAQTQNPLAQLLAIYGYRFDDLHANVSVDPDNGLRGDAHVYQFRSDSLALDTVFVDIKQDSAFINFHTGVVCEARRERPAFSAYVDGYVGTNQADAHLTYFNRFRGKGIDLGVHAEATPDSVLHARFYPEQPVLGYRRFSINEGNFLELSKGNRATADIHLHSLEDSCTIDIMAAPTAELMQNVNAVIKNLNIEELVAVVPGMPKMKGLLNLDANYAQDLTESFRVTGLMGIDRFDYEGTPVGDIGMDFAYKPNGEDNHSVDAVVSHNAQNVAVVKGEYNAANDGFLDVDVDLTNLPMSMTAPFIPDQIVNFDGYMDGSLCARGPLDHLDINGRLQPDSMTMHSDLYSLDWRFANEPFLIENSRISFDRYNIYGPGGDEMTLNGWVDFADLENIDMTLSLYAKNFKLIDAPRTRRSVLFGTAYGDIFVRVNGTLDKLRVRGMVNVLPTTNLTYVMSETPLSVDYRLEDIVTFVDFSNPPPSEEERVKTQFVGLDMQVTLNIEDGAEFRCEFSADRQSYLNVQGGGSMILNSTAEGMLNLIGRYTINEGEMKYTLPVIPLKTFKIENGSYIEFTGNPTNPTLNFAASEQTKTTVSDAMAGSRSVLFNAGLKVTGTLENMELLFTIEAPEDLAVQNELASMSKEEKNKMAVGLLCTGMYLSSSNTSGVSANNALNNFLQNEINNIAGQAMSTMVDVNVGMEQSMRDDGSQRTDYSFKFSKRFFSNRLNVVLGGRVNADGNTQENESGAYIDDISLEWRLNTGGTRYVRLYHEKNYDNLIEGELTENGASVVLRRKFDHLSDIIIWKKRRKEE